MKAASLHELKKELTELPPTELLELFMRLAKYKKENKELLTYLLFEAHDQSSYIQSVKQLVTAQLAEMNQSHLYLAKKTIRKTLRTTDKYIKYAQSDTTEIDLRIYFCLELKKSKIAIHTSPVLQNLYNRQIDKIKKAISSLHEDLQSDYGIELSAL
jgi:hypothetical protein